MAVACSIFTLGGRVQLFWTAFDMAMTEVPLKVSLGYNKIVFCVFPKNNHGHTLMLHLHDYFFEMPKNKISAILMQLLMVPMSCACQKLSKPIEPIHVK